SRASKVRVAADLLGAVRGFNPETANVDERTVGTTRSTRAEVVARADSAFSADSASGRTAQYRERWNAYVGRSTCRPRCGPAFQSTVAPMTARLRRTTMRRGGWRSQRAASGAAPHAAALGPP